MIKAVLFDLDGVLVDACEWHREALDLALAQCGFPTIPEERHYTEFNGLPTREKLRRLGLESLTIERINTLKQRLTLEVIHERCEPRLLKTLMMGRLRDRGIKIAVCSNSVRASIHAMLDRSLLFQFVEFYLGNEDVSRPKPDPMMYTKAMCKLNVAREETLIVEDSPHGIAAAKASGAHVMVVKESRRVYWGSVRDAILAAESTQKEETQCST